MIEHQLVVKRKWGTQYKLEVEDLGEMRLPPPTAKLIEQRRTVKAIRILYPDAEIRLRSMVNHPKKGLVVRDLMTKGMRL